MDQEGNAAAEGGAEAGAEADADGGGGDDGQPDGGAGGEGEGSDKAGDGKKQLTPEQRQIYGLNKRVGRLTNDRARLLAENEQLRKQAGQRPAPTDDAGADDDAGGDAGGQKKTQLTEDEVERRATQLANQRQEQDRFNGMVEKTIASGTKAYGKDFDAMVESLYDVIGGFSDESRRVRPITAAILKSDQSHALIKHLSENPEDASDIAAMDPIDQVSRIALLAVELGKASQPKASAAPKPIVPSKGSGTVTKDASKMTDKEWFESQKVR